MARTKEQKQSKRDPKTWEGYEKEHSQKVGDIVNVEHFGVIRKNWKVIELQTDPTWGLPCYKLEAPDGTKYPYIGKWFNQNTQTKILV